MKVMERQNFIRLDALYNAIKLAVGRNVTKLAGDWELNKAQQLSQICIMN